MSRLLTQFSTGLARAGQGIYDRLAGAYTSTPAVPHGGNTGSGSGLARLVRDGYAVRDAMLDGTVYNTRALNGYQWDILKAMGKPCGSDAPPILPYYNPVPAIVGCYQNALGGKLGEDLNLERPDGDPLAAAVADAVARVWRWSNLDTRMEELVTLVANQGSAGIRIVGEGTGSAGRVYLQFEHPSWVADAEEDSRGNLVNVLLRYDTYYSETLGEAYTTAAAEELIGKEKFSRVIDGTQVLEPDQRINGLGVCPYVLVRHARRNGDFFGRHAYEGSELAIHGINWGLSQLDEATARAINETVFMAGAGQSPDVVQLGRLTAMYVKLANGVPAPELKYIVPQLAIGETGESIVRNIELLYTRQPELILNALKLLSGTSGETLAQVLKPVEAAVLRARRLYESDIVRALQIALSVGVLNGVFDLGTGSGTKEAADRAYDDGQGVEGMRFAARPALAPTVYQTIQQATADMAETVQRVTVMAQAESVTGLSGDEVLRLGRYTPKEIAAIKAEKQDEDETSDPGDETGLADGGDGGDDGNE